MVHCVSEVSNCKKKIHFEIQMRIALRNPILSYFFFFDFANSFHTILPYDEKIMHAKFHVVSELHVLSDKLRL